MQQVMQEGVFGRREILPESMWTGLTRVGEGAPHWSTSVKRAMSGFALSEAGVWIPTAADSESDLDALTRKVGTASSRRLLVSYRTKRLALTVLKSVDIGDDGCWTSSKNTEGRPGLTELTELDTNCSILEDPANMDDIRLCSEPNCLYHRHYDITLNVPSGRRSLLYPNRIYYNQFGDKIITAWGDELPTAQQSRVDLHAFQMRCAPYVDSESSLLTLGGISQLSLIPATGCWFTRSYYMTPVGVAGYDNWQYDAYGRLKIPAKRAKEVNYGDYAMLGHRAVWITMGNSVRDSKKWALNHRCGFRPCANPGHLVEVSNQVNNLHGKLMAIARGMMEGAIPIKEGVERLKSVAGAQGIDPANIETFWDGYCESLTQGS